MPTKRTMVNPQGAEATPCFYHAHHDEPQGAETALTFFLQRKLARPYHIDYARTGPKWAVKQVEVGSPERWLRFSDHMPVVVDLARAGQA